MPNNPVRQVNVSVENSMSQPEPASIPDRQMTQPAPISVIPNRNRATPVINSIIFEMIM